MYRVHTATKEVYRLSEKAQNMENITAELDKCPSILQQMRMMFARDSDVMEQFMTQTMEALEPNADNYNAYVEVPEVNWHMLKELLCSAEGKAKVNMWRTTSNELLAMLQKAQDNFATFFKEVGCKTLIAAS